MSIVSVDNISPIGSGTTVTVNKSVTLESGNTNITGVCTATSFSGSGANLTGVLSDIVDDTSPQLGGNLDCNNKNISLNDSTGGTNNRIKIGTHDDLHLWHNSSTGNSNISNYNGNLYLQGNNGSGTGVNQIAIISNAAVELNYQGNKKLETTNTGVSVTGNLVFASGSGIDFSATANTSATGASTSSELLDDYEEGSFTPYIDREYGSPIVSYDAQDGYYTKIGRVVYFYAEVRLNGYNGNGSYGNTFLRGLPFNSATRNGGRGVWNSVQYNSYYRDIDTTDGERDIAVVQHTSEKVVFYVMRSENSWTAPPAPDANDQFKIGGFYFT